MAEPYLASEQLHQLFGAKHIPEVKVEAEPLEFYGCVVDRYAKTPKVTAFFDYLYEMLADKGHD